MVLPQVEEFALGDGLKGWRIPSRTGMAIADELATLHLAVGSLPQNRRAGQAKVVDGVMANLRAMLAPDVLRSWAAREIPDRFSASIACGGQMPI